ncbi:MAG: calcium-translocating P-type ATPase, PMCA-type [Candidatus Improbicoccus pseudotrichonymphae]|uniref:P-type Ca(2+) transporter n=1 Tax=Candidatus Improbicoccus pseudotrichonymphae TaxID=3033792 RepID=A0AA48KXE0_9FIRM|nr:MAG: calcium-translocating P-type ATPase, PMCA-type [Candidatus Improbicoccus pseudotrichonymphae]
MNWQSMKIEEVLKNLNTDIDKGLDANEVKKRQRIYGKNLIEEEREINFFKKIIEQFSDFMVITLFIAAGISFIVSVVNKNNDYIDSIIILLIVFINAIIGITQEKNAEKAINSLKKLSETPIKVLRSGIEQRVISENIVPGDILLLETGDLICADARLIKTQKLKTEESALTGESLSVSKNENTIFDEKTPIYKIKNMIFSSSFVTSGRSIAVVTATGMKTQVGKIAKLINKNSTPPTPLQTQLNETGKMLSMATMIICCIVFILGLIQKADILEIFMIAVSLAVAAIPEGLPFVVTLALASGVKRMAKKNAIIRKPNSVEALGNANVICTDKTGTLTQNKMSVIEIRNIKGIINDNDAKEIINCSVLCNNAKQKISCISGEPTEKALLEKAIELNISKNSLEKEMPRIKEIPFDSSRKIMTTVHKTKNRFITITKGAPDFLLELCTKYKKGEQVFNLSKNSLKDIKNNYEIMASRALRVLAMAYKETTIENTNENNFTFLGLVGIADPIRSGARKAVRLCKEAHVKPVMITGDHILTAKAVARELEIIKKDSEAISGSQLDKIGQKDLEKNIFSYSLFARVLPEHKMRIVKAFQSRNAIVIMTGDGVNDGPALKAANIGCAMGISGTDVAKSVSDMVLTDDNFSTIVETICQGRGIYENIKKTIHFLLSTNIGEIVVIFCACLFHLPAPLLAIHLLWINFVTDSFPALALGMDPIESNIIKTKPSDPSQKILSGTMGLNIMTEGLGIGITAIIVFIIGSNLFDNYPLEPIVGRTMAFVSLGLSQLIHAFNVRSKKSIFKTGILTNKKLVAAVIFCAILQIIVTLIPVLNTIFKTVNLDFPQWCIVLAATTIPIIISEIEKFAIRNKYA